MKNEKRKFGKVKKEQVEKKEIMSDGEEGER